MSHGRAVDRRAATVGRECLNKLALLDTKLGRTPRGQVGPLQQRLIDLGGVSPLVVGAYGEVNVGWHDLMDECATRQAPRRWRSMLSPNVATCASVLKRTMQRRLCFVLARGRSRLLHSRLEMLLNNGRGAYASAHDRARAEAQQREARATR